MVFCVEPISCKHLQVEEFEKCVDLNVFQENDLTIPTCSQCNDKSENWICLQCGVVSCSRHVNGHAGVHFETTQHPISASFSDHSFWCYACDTYVYDKCLYDVEDVLETLKFFSKRKIDHSDDEFDYEISNNNNTNNNNIKKDNKPEETASTSTSTSTTTTTTTTSHTVNDITKEIESIQITDKETKPNTTTTSTPPTTSTTTEETKKEETKKEETKKEEAASLSSSGSKIIQKVLDVFGIGSSQPKVLPSKPQVLSEMNLAGIANYISTGKAKNIIVMTGAGISVAAGIPDFRTKGTGLYSTLGKYNLPYPEAIFDIDYFKENPQPFFVLAKELYPGSFNPTPVHHFIKLLHDKGLLLRNYTQNIDTLERIAQIPEDKLVEAHGSFATAHCISCRKEHTKDFVKDEIFSERVPKCIDCKDGVVKPDITFFGESLPSRFSHCSSQDFDKCDLLIVIGTSLKVQPFASLINFPKNVPRLLINFEVVGKSFGYGGFKFDDPSNYLDCKWIGDCQKGIQDFVDLLNWTEEFKKLTTPTSNL
ncbi:NAD(+)-dependent deacetylase [Tieghemostelium lacteum]|uniref:NAD(+)-dependent deacetylase n=1 Tax=Tieghemostelium lacteum TaxID=361077 RepID=A0A151ZFP9_TIELA|nr:NAD(+)-dependent deacetylase [Tieghemostelium lacteum]|eukprot:KYQ92793.1 NAD(+)-dependent deacetylase [Tieghemostelium lacteum]